jgi:hypothetical protein
MKIKLMNKTPLSVHTLGLIDANEAAFRVVIAKGTFEIVPGAALRLARKQAPIRQHDEPWHTEKRSSLRYEDDLAPFKPLSEVIVNATAHAPSGKPAAQWHAGVKVGPIQKRVVVTGPRVWVHTPLLGWSLSPAVPVRSVPVRYEKAFGGEGNTENPVGVGHVDPKKVDRAGEVPAPQILTADGRAPVFGEPYPVEGFGAISKLWEPRRSRAGTFDPNRPMEEQPRFPKDHDPLYRNAAHLDLIGDGFLRGYEDVELENLHPGHAKLSFTLPGLVVAAAIVDRVNYRYGSPARLDTVWIDAETMQVELTWRATLPVYKDGIARIDIGMIARDSNPLLRALTEKERAAS